jgi:aspartyl-tRNA(Asn)/glutamyl-tRNA(Gln) amidotransferase subunit C
VKSVKSVVFPSLSFFGCGSAGLSHPWLTREPREDSAFQWGPGTSNLQPMAAAPIDIRYVAHLARLELTGEEEVQFAQQLGHVLHHFEKLNQLDVSQVEPTAHAIPMANVFRPDETAPPLPHAAALQNAPASTNGLFLVPKIVE